MISNAVGFLALARRLSSKNKTHAKPEELGLGDF